MCKKVIYLISFVLVLSLAGSAQAVDKTWTNGNGTGIWNDGLNWDVGSIPTSGDHAFILTNTPGPTVQSAGMVSNGIYMNGTSELIIDGGGLDANYHLYAGREVGSVATVTVNGTFEAASIRAGENGIGLINMNGGTITTPEFDIAKMSASSGSHTNLHGGVIAVSTRFQMRRYGAVGTMDVTAGTLILDYDMEATIQDYIDDGWITAYGGAGTLLLDYDVTNAGKTTLSAIPEPATIALLGLGGLALLRRRKH